MEEEIWKSIKGCEGYYEVSSLGRVRSIERTIVKNDGRVTTYKGRIIKPYKNNQGYLIVSLYVKGKCKKFLVHRLVVEAFIPNTENKPCVDHINTIRDDNRVENLRWATYKENSNNELTNKKQSESRKEYMTEEVKKEISERSKGRNLSEETKKKISETRKGRYKGKDSPHSIILMTILPSGLILEPMCMSDLSKLINMEITTISRIIKSGKPYKPKKYKYKHLEGLQIFKIPKENA